MARRLGSAMMSKTDSTLLIYSAGHMLVKAFNGQRLGSGFHRRAVVCGINGSLHRDGDRLEVLAGVPPDVEDERNVGAGGEVGGELQVDLHSSGNQAGGGPGGGGGRHGGGGRRRTNKGGSGGPQEP